MPICWKCKEDLPETAYAPSSLKRGAKHRSYQTCRLCVSVRMRDMHQRLPEKRRANDLKWKENHPHQFKAKRALKSAVQWGRIEVRPCEVCGDPKSHGHHFSYDPRDWLSVIWLCATHHKAVHKGTIDTTTLPVTYGQFPKQPKGAVWSDEMKEYIIKHQSM